MENKTFVGLFKKVAISVWPILVASLVVDQLLTAQFEKTLSSPEGIGAQIWFLGLASILNSLIFPVIIYLLCFHALFNLKSQNFARQLNQTLIETVRSWGSILLWGLFLLLPGIFRMYELMFVPFVVNLSSAYDNNQADAFKLSTEFARKYIWRLSGILFLFQVVFPLLLTATLDQYRNFLKHPLSATALSSIDLLLTLSSVFILSRIFVRWLKEKHDLIQAG